MNIIPTPKNITMLKGEFILPYSGNILIESSSKEAAYSASNILKQALKDNLGFSYSIRRGNYDAEIILKEEKDYPTEKYSLLISEKGIEIEGGKRGIIYGVHTLTQIIMESGSRLSNVIIEDYPYFSDRGFYHDITRGRIPTLDYLKKLADRLSFYKINQMQLYIEHCFLFKDLSEVWRDDTPLTSEEILELDRYCDSIGVELVPSLSTFGHMYKILNTESFGYMCEIDNAPYKEFGLIDRMRHHTLNITMEESFSFVCSILDEYIPLFKSDKFNICADETFDLGRGKSKAYCDKVGLPRVYMDFVKRIIKKVSQAGKTPMLWGDIMLHFPEYISELPKECICLDWHYEKDVKEDSVKTFAKLPVKTYVCPGVNGWNRLINEKYAYTNIKKMCSYGKKYGVLGVLNTDWGDFGHINHPDHSLPGLIYGAEGSWAGEMESQAVLDEKISRLAYANSSGKVLSIINELANTQYFQWRHLIDFKEKVYNKENYEKEVAKRLSEKKEDVLAVNEKVKNLRVKLYDEIKNTDKKNRDMLYSYLHAAEGIELFNLLGGIFIQRRNLKVAHWELAVRLEYWLNEYQKIWRSVSKESELNRITEGIVFFADRLREYPNEVRINVLDFVKDKANGYSKPFLAAAKKAATYPSEMKKIIYFPKGKYDFYAEYSPVRELYVSNTCGPQHTKYKNKHLAILLENLENVEVNGSGSMFLMHGDITTFAALGCKNVEFKDFVLDHASPSVVDITVNKITKNQAEVSVPSCFSYEITKDKKSIIWKGEKLKTTQKPYWEGKNSLIYNQKYNTKTGRTYRGNTSKCELFENIEKIEEVKKGLLRFTKKDKFDKSLEGLCYQMRNIMRTTPGALVACSSNVTMNNLTVRYLHGFGVVGQLSKDIFFKNCDFVPDYKSGRTTAGFADFIHLSSIAGKVEIIGCNFENPHDDPINVHGTFLQVMEVLDKDNTEFVLRYMHHETGGFPQYYPGDVVEFATQDTLLPLEDADGIVERRVVSVVNDYKGDKRLIKIKVASPVKIDKRSKTKIKDCNGLNYIVENVTYTPSLTVRDCVFKSVPTRGILVTTRKDVLIEDNKFEHLDMSGISISCDGSNWFESGRTKNVHIRNNEFLDLTCHAVLVCPTAEVEEGNYIHKKVVVENNTFKKAKDMDVDIIKARGLDELIVRNNITLS